MKRKSMSLISALLIPICVLATSVIGYQTLLFGGISLTLPITGYDTRNLLSGHYLTYRINYGPRTNCQRIRDAKIAYMCLYQRKKNWRGKVYYSNQSLMHASCEAYIKGSCRHGQFIGGIERLYIPESYDNDIDKVVRSNKASLSAKITNTGKAQIRELLINNKPWRKYMSEIKK